MATALTLNATAVNFGSAGVGSSKASVMSLYNYTAAAVPITSISTGSAIFPITVDGCSGTTLGAGKSCSFTVSFAPSTMGLQSGTLTVSSTLTTNPSATMSGTGVQPLYLSASTLAFGNEGLGLTSAAKTVYVYNYSGSQVNAQIPVSTGPFTVAGGTGCATLANNATCNFTVTFTAPSTAGAVPSTPLNVVVNGTTTLPLTATGTAVQPLYLSASTLAFGNEGLGLTSAAKTVYVYNYSGGQVNAQIPVSTGPFTVAGGTGCATLATNATCNFTVTFTAPSTAGAVPSTPLNVVVNGTTTLPLTATGTAVQPLYLSASTLAFGNEGLGLTSAAKTVYVYNYSGSQVNAQIPVSTGPFTVAGGTGCATLANNATCNFTVTFTAPSTAGAVPSTPLNVVVNGTTTLPLTATGTAVQPLYLSASTLAFGNEGLGLTSAAKTVYVYNYSGSQVNAQIPVSTGPFTVAGGTGCATLATNATCNFTVTFTAPSTAGAVPSTPLNVVVNGTTTLPLTATGTAVQPLYLSASTLAFGNEGLGLTSAAKTVYVYNYSGSQVNAQIPVSTGPFTVAGGTGCATLATNATCNFTVTFTPPALRARFLHAAECGGEWHDDLTANGDGQGGSQRFRDVVVEAEARGSVPPPVCREAAISTSPG